MKATVVGVGATGARAARQLSHREDIEDLVVVDSDRERSQAVSESLGEFARSGPSTRDVGALDDCLGDRDVVVIATATGSHSAIAAAAIRGGSSAVSTGHSREDVESLLDLCHEAEVLERSIVVGAGFSPGFSCLLAQEVARHFEKIDEIHIARMGTGGPDCARQHHRALSGEALDWVEGIWSRRGGGSGRELVWFPDPIGGQDCYRAALPDAVLLRPSFEGAERITVRQGATRRDRLSAQLPMLRKPHPEGLVGGLRVEVRGWKADGSYDVEVRGAIDRPAAAAGAVAGLVAGRVGSGQATKVGTWGLSQIEDPVELLGELRDLGIRAAVFEGSTGF